MTAFPAKFEARLKFWGPTSFIHDELEVRFDRDKRYTV
jgi:hypothetical protein